MQVQQCIQSSGTNHPNGLTILLIASRRFRNAQMRSLRGKKTSGFRIWADLVAIAEWKYPFPSRTRKSSALTPMVLHSCGRVGSRQVFFLSFRMHAAISFVAALGPYTKVLSLVCSLDLIHMNAKCPVTLPRLQDGNILWQSVGGLA